MLAIGNAVDGRPFGRFGGFNFGAPKIRTFPTYSRKVDNGRPFQAGPVGYAVYSFNLMLYEPLIIYELRNFSMPYIWTLVVYC